jgi:hypothetical protein
MERGREREREREISFPSSCFHACQSKPPCVDILAFLDQKHRPSNMCPE